MALSALLLLPLVAAADSSGGGGTNWYGDSRSGNTVTRQITLSGNLSSGPWLSITPLPYNRTYFGRYAKQFRIVQADEIAALLYFDSRSSQAIATYLPIVNKSYSASFQAQAQTALVCSSGNYTTSSLQTGWGQAQAIATGCPGGGGVPAFMYGAFSASAGFVP
jgi:hypothetical protein